jgi:hypothetical protein
MSLSRRQFIKASGSFPASNTRAVAAFPVLLLAGRFALGHFVVQLSDLFVSMSWS